MLNNLVAPKLSHLPLSSVRAHSVTREQSFLLCKQMSESNNNFQMKDLDQGMVEEC